MPSFAEQIETFSIYFQGGVRRSIIIFFGASILFLVPLYFAGQASAQVWSTVPINPNKIEVKKLLQPKTIVEQNFTIDRSQVVPLEGTETVLYTTINNRENKTIGYFPFVYKIQILDNKGTVLEESFKSSFLLPGDIKYITATSNNQAGTRLVISPEPETQSRLFNPESDNLAKRVNLEVRNPKILDFKENSNLKISATIKNNEFVEIKELNILYILRDDRDRVVGIGEYILDYLKPNQERTFELEYPRPRFRTATSLDIRTGVNYLDANNVRLPELNEPVIDSSSSSRRNN